MKKINLKTLMIIFLMIIMTIINVIPVQAIGRRVTQQDKYIWIYVFGQRKLLSSDMGYPCFGQGIDNKNVLFVPLKLLTELTGCELSPLKKKTNGDGSYILYADVTGNKSYQVILGDNNINGIPCASAPFVLKGTEENGTNVIMVPLGFAKDGLNLDIEVEKPRGRGVYDYCSLAINFDGENVTIGSKEIIGVPDSTGNSSIASDTTTSDKYFVSVYDSDYYHKQNCSRLTGTTSSISQFECEFWGYKPCPECFSELYSN